MLEKIVGAIKNGQTRDTGNIGHTRHRGRRQTKHNTENKKKSDEQHRPHQNS